MCRGRFAGAGRRSCHLFAVKRVAPVSNLIWNITSAVAPLSGRLCNRRGRRPMLAGDYAGMRHSPLAANTLLEHRNIALATAR
eukprot:933579-Pyramimonas_sp.AAC.1